MSHSTRKDGPGWRSTSTTCSWDSDPERPSVELPVSPSKIEADERVRARSNEPAGRPLAWPIETRSPESPIIRRQV